jgi:pSer/pThr/pTyr-binding forkhead associated (FHA) protein
MTLECPKCKSPVARDGQRFCYRCGQELRDYYDSLNIEIKDQRSDSNPLPSNSSNGAATNANEVMPNRTAEFSSPQDPAASAAPQAGGTVALSVEEVVINTEPVITRHTAEQRAILRILLPTGDVFDREITQTETQMGKGPRNDIVIADPAVSAAHAVIRVENGEYVVDDLGSRNGTFVNSERISAPRPLRHGDVIGMGLSKLTFRLGNHSETGAIDVTEIIPAPKPPPLTEDSLAAAVIAEGLVKASDVERLRGSDAGGRRLYRALIEHALAGEESLRDLMSRVFRIPVIDLGSAQVDKTVVEKLSARTARDRLLFPVAEEADSVVLAVADPTDTGAVEEAKREIGMPVDVHLATATEILEQVDRYYGPRLIGVLPSGEKLEYFINQHETEIGKALHNHIVVSDPTVSNTHAILIARDKAYSVVDLGSRNGTFINGERLGAHAHTLRHGDTIQLGQTVLTFKNRAETTANITATLSPSALAEVRRRAGIEDKAEPGPGKPEDAPAPAIVVPLGVAAAAAPVPAAQNITPAPLTPEAVADGEDTKGDKKKKKKKKGADDRLKAAYISGVSRIIAQVFAVVLSVALALYISQRNSSTEKPVAELTAKGKAKIKVPSSGAGAPFNAGKDAAGKDVVVEASGVIQVPNTEGVLLVDDSKANEILWMQLDSTGQQAGQIKFVNFGGDVSDPEGITYDGSFFYLVGSQSHAEAAQRNALARFTFDPASQAIQGRAEVMSNLRDFLLQNVPELKEVSEKPGNAGGLNVEGIAWDLVNGRLLLGLRSPVINGKALVVPIKLRDPRGPFTTENLLPPDPAIQLSLGGLGIRDIQYDKRTNLFLIIAGAHSSGGNAESWLWEWNGDADQSNPASLPQQVIQLDAAMKPEGVTNVKMGGRDYMLIVGDGGRYMKLDYAEGP